MLCGCVVFVVTSCCNVLNIHSEFIQRKSLLHSPSGALMAKTKSMGGKSVGKCAWRWELSNIYAKFERTFLVARNQGQT